MTTATEHLAGGSWDLQSACGVVRLDYEHRHRRRLLLHTDEGEEFLLDLPRAVGLRDGDGLRLDDGRLLLVRALDERVLDIDAQDGNALLRIAWHLGNRHLPTQFLPTGIRIRYDHVIAEMIEGLGGHVRQAEAAFDPERGAYDPGTGGKHHRHADAEHHHGG